MANEKDPNGALFATEASLVGEDAKVLELLRSHKQELEADIKAQGICGKNCGWITSCILAGLSMGTGAFIYASNYAKYGLEGSGVLGPGPCIVFALVKVFRQVYFRCKQGQWFK